MDIRGSKPALTFGRLHNPEMVRIARGIRQNMLTQRPQERPLPDKTWAGIRYVVVNFFRQLLVRITEKVVPPTPSERVINAVRKLPYSL
jgi:hypothetical protein